jgi:hypothetical protein
MKKYITTSPNYAGEVYIIYSDDNLLLALDFRNAQLTERQTHYLRMKTPTVFGEDFTSHFAEANLTFVPEDYKITFEDFWERYNEKRNKIRCERLWKALSKTAQIEAYAGVLIYDRFLKNVGWGRTKAEPDTYLRYKYWQNEYK